jgi:hypothetical protein
VFLLFPPCVQDDEVGLRGERPGDAHALLLAARHLAREAGRERGRQANLGQEPLDPPAPLLAAQAEEQAERPAQDLGDALARVQRLVRRLVDELDRRSCSRVRAASRGGSGRPARLTAPAAGGRRPVTTRASVLLPLPDSPTTATTRPRGTARSIPSSARGPRP